jgi:hypothetical protein
MTEKILSILISIGVGFLLAIPALILGYWLGKTGKAPNRSWASLFFCVVMSLVNQFLFPGTPFRWFALIAIAGSTLGVYRMDMYWASKDASKQTNSNSDSSL